MRKFGEDVTEVLDDLPASFRVIRHVRPKFSCRACEMVVQAPAPDRPIRRGRATAGLLAHVLVAKYADHLPLYRQCDIYEREGVDLERSTLADWVGQSASLLRPLVEALGRHVMTDDRIHADGYSGFTGLYQAGRVIEAACWAHVRRHVHDLHVTGDAPLASEALMWIQRIYAIEDDVRGRPPDERRRVRQARAKPLLAEMQAWLEATLGRVSRRGDLAVAIRYALTRWTALTRYVDDGSIEVDNNPVERAIRPIALGRKNWLFARSDAGGARTAAIASLIATARRHGINPEAYLRHVLERIAEHPARQVAELPPWDCAELAAAPALRDAA